MKVYMDSLSDKLLSKLSTDTRTTGTTHIMVIKTRKGTYLIVTDEIIETK